MRLFYLGVFLPLVVAGCSTAPATQTTGNIKTATENFQQHSSDGGAVQGLAFAQARCADCHGVMSGQISTNQEAPTFETIVNARGLTDKTIQAWLRNSHNFPEMMNFEIDAKHIDDLSAYMLTLKSRDYRPPIQ